jgi:hypothetical protein
MSCFNQEEANAFQSMIKRFRENIFSLSDDSDLGDILHRFQNYSFINQITKATTKPFRKMTEPRGKHPGWKLDQALSYIFCILEKGDAIMYKVCVDIGGLYRFGPDHSEVSFSNTKSTTWTSPRTRISEGSGGGSQTDFRRVCGRY